MLLFVDVCCEVVVTMFVVVGWLWFGVCCLLFVVCVVCCLLFAIGALWIVACCLVLILRCSLLVACCMLFVVC